MRKDLYDDMYEVEEKHWWYRAKRYNYSLVLQKFLRDKKGQRNILDIGCGTGKNIETLQTFGDVQGIDSSQRAVAFCKMRGLQNASVAKGEATGSKANTFDIVTLFDVLEHVDEHTLLTEVHRILKTSGILLITVPAFSILWSQWDVALHHKRRYTKATLSSTLTNEGFQIMHVSYLYSFLFLPALIIRIIKSIMYNKKNYPSDFGFRFPLIHPLLFSLAKAESLIANIIPPPFGTSILCLATKKHVE